jgi:hypothetical protein
MSIPRTTAGTEIQSRKDMENIRLISKPKDKLLKILQPYLTFCSKRNHYDFQGKGNFQRETHNMKRFPHNIGGASTKRRYRVFELRGVKRKRRATCVKWCPIVRGPKLLPDLPHGRLLEHLFIRYPYKQLRLRPKWIYNNVDMYTFLENFCSRQ